VLLSKILESAWIDLKFNCRISAFRCPLNVPFEYKFIIFSVNKFSELIKGGPSASAS